MRTPYFLQLHHPAGGALAAEARAGLQQQPASLPPKFFYDALGSRLFDAITELPEYYPTRTEAAILAAHGPEIAQAVRAVSGDSPVMIDLGAGNCAKAARLFPLLDPRTYVAVDISTEFLQSALQALQREHPARALVGVGMDFAAGFRLPPEIPGIGPAPGAAAGAGVTPRLVFYPGSSIGNFSPEQAQVLLRDIREAAAGGALLIGVDRVKPVAVLEAAYDDPLGVTAAFNLNLLRHLNQLVATDFQVGQWRHRAMFNAEASRIEMHLHAREALTVRWPGGERRFLAGESIHTENSYKWTPETFSDLLRQAGFAQVRHWTDAQAWFSVFLAAG